MTHRSLGSRIAMDFRFCQQLGQAYASAGFNWNQLFTTLRRMDVHAGTLSERRIVRAYRRQLVLG